MSRLDVRIPLAFVALICVISLIPARVHGQLRLVGTNLVDFRPIAQAADTVPVTDLYRIVGTIGQITDSGVLVQRFLGRYYEYRPQSDLAPRLYGSSGVLTMLAASRLGGRNGLISYGHFLSMSPQMQMHYQPFMHSETILLTNCPPKLAVLTEKINIFAMPAGTFSYESIGQGRLTVKRYDLGVPTTNLAGLGHHYFQITTSGPVRVSMPKTNKPPKPPDQAVR